MTPTARTLQECRKRGWTAEVVEQTIGRTFIKRDLFGCIDIVACTPDGILGIQVTTGAHHANRMEKAAKEPRLRAWFAARARFAVWSWAKQGARGKRKAWTLREQEFEPPVRTIVYRAWNEVTRS